MPTSLISDIWQLAELVVEVRVAMYILYMELVRIGHIGNIINIDHMGSDWRNLDDEFLSVWILYIVTPPSQIWPIRRIYIQFGRVDQVGNIIRAAQMVKVSACLSIGAVLPI